jgi:hypothetical protein
LNTRERRERMVSDIIERLRDRECKFCDEAAAERDDARASSAVVATLWKETRERAERAEADLAKTEQALDRLTVRINELRTERATLELESTCSYCKGTKSDCFQCGGSGKEIDRLSREVNAKSAFELGFGSRIARLETDLAAARETVRKIRSAENMTCVWHIADAFLERTATDPKNEK